MAEQRIDTRIYGAEELTPRNDVTAQAASTTYTAPVAVPAVQAVQGSSLLAEGEANLRANQREQATLMESTGAAMTQWLPFKAWDYYNTPKFDWEPGFNSASMLKSVNFPLDAEQEKFLIESKSSAEFQHKLNNLQDQRMAYEAMGDHPLAAFLTGVIDPGYLAIDVASLGAGRMAKLVGMGARAQKVAAGTTAFAGAYAGGKMEQQIAPVSETEVILNALANGAATGFFHDGGTLVPKDKEFPATKLSAVVQDIKGRADDALDHAKVKVEEKEAFVPPRKVEEPVVGGGEVPLGRGTGHRVGTEPPFRYAAVSGREMLYNLSQHSDGMIAILAKKLHETLGDEVEIRVTAKSNLYQRSRAYYDPAQHAVYISPASSANTQLHEIAHAVTTHKLIYGEEHPTSVHGKIASEIAGLMEDARSEYALMKQTSGAEDKFIKYHLDNVHEFVAGLYTGTSTFTKMLSNMPAKTGGTVLSKTVDAVRKLLGLKPKEHNALLHAIGLTEKLIDSPLNVTLLRTGQPITRDATGHGIIPGSMSIRLQHPEDILTQADAKRSLAQALSHKISWSLHKTLSSFGAKAKEVADLLVDDPLSMAGDSVASQHRAIRADLAVHQRKYEDLLRDALAAQGFGLKNRILKPREAIAAQAQLEREVGGEMLRRNRLSMDGASIDKTVVPKYVSDMADALDSVSKAALEEMKRAGVKGAEDISEHSGYFSRRWDISKIENIERKLINSGLTEKEARLRIQDMVSVGIQRANGWDADLASDVSKAILDRARRKGYFEDSAFRAHQGNDAAKEVRDLLTGTGISEERLQRALDVLTGKVDEKGKPTHLKHRVDMAMDESLRLPDGSAVTIADMIDMNLTATTERYLDSVATQTAFARKGLPSASDVTKLREDFLRSIESHTKREDAAELFDQTLNALRGLPTGEKLSDMMRKSQAVTQMVGLAASGMWQITEYATAMMQYGMLRTVGNMFKELPGVRSLFNDAKEASHLRNVLARNASEDIRMRPYVQRMEDGFEIPVSDAAQLALMQAKQLVPYINAMKYIQHHQARTVGNLIVNTFERAVRGDAKAVKALEGYGLEGHRVVGIAGDISQHGMDTAKWSKATWDTVRGPLTKMMDDAVLKSRTGEIPAFAQFTQLGKFLFTFRSFTLGAHNKVLAGTLNRDGFAGLSLLMLYQFPLTAAVTAANNSIQGKKPLDDKTLVATALGQMGSLGLASELVGIASGTKQQFGAPGLIGADRLYKVGSSLSGATWASTFGEPKAGAWGKAGGAFTSALPIISLIPGVKAIGEHLKD